jgi:hypothetical protein
MMATEAEPQLADAKSGYRCTEEAGSMLCNRPEGHEGEHYDWCDEIFWRRRTEPDPEPGGATSAWEHHRHG